MQNNIIDKPSSLPLDQVLPDGQVVNRAWLQARGFDRSRVDFYLLSHKLVRVGRGAYRRPGPQLKWEHFVYSLQELGLDLHVGGRSALDIVGYAHYLNMSGVKRIELYTTHPLPAWLKSIEGIEFEYHKMLCFDYLDANTFTSRAFGHWDWQLRLSSIELALMELLCDLKNEADFSVADKYFESATSLRPKLVNAVLRQCTQIKAKRLFLWFAKRHNHPWVHELDLNNIDLGSGKRVIVKGGTLDKEYQITVPREMTGNAQFFF
jgi:hypothetical protein